jgi:hypothetical protein
LAQVIHDDHAFDRLSILADALEDVGCTNQDLLEHCRHSALHLVRPRDRYPLSDCWVVNLVLLGVTQC